MIVNVPTTASGPIVSHIQDFQYGNGKTHAVRQLDDGRVVIDLHYGQFVNLKRGPQGKLWEDANPDLARE